MPLATHGRDVIKTSLCSCSKVYWDEVCFKHIPISKKTNENYLLYLYLFLL